MIQVISQPLQYLKENKDPWSVISTILLYYYTFVSLGGMWSFGRAKPWIGLLLTVIVTDVLDNLSSSRLQIQSELYQVIWWH